MIGIVIVILLVLDVYLRMKSRAEANPSIPNYANDMNKATTVDTASTSCDHINSELNRRTMVDHSPEIET